MIGLLNSLANFLIRTEVKIQVQLSQIEYSTQIYLS